MVSKHPTFEVQRSEFNIPLLLENQRPFYDTHYTYYIRYPMYGIY